MNKVKINENVPIYPFFIPDNEDKTSFVNEYLNPLIKDKTIEGVFIINSCYYKSVIKETEMIIKYKSSLFNEFKYLQFRTVIALNKQIVNKGFNFRTKTNISLNDFNYELYLLNEEFDNRFSFGY